ncbi:MAG: 16S rRNA (cytosine(1402)-N(4))-methyltransferase RsmH [Rickettsiales bacterium]|jgi:16S rRNA (cytosine1402-N4)-methyltransferase|nr:16S rRNA (cytosine(1402)-N(4))-methyltransferase RsmH [Rickettsiales bacterium]
MLVHIPVLLDKVLLTLGEVEGRTIVDATFGAGGYSRAFLERGARVIAFDRDPNVAKFADEFLQKYPGQFQFINAPFSEIAAHATGATDIVFDFGVSSMQIDSPTRGFSWRFDSPLDMRMDPTRGPTAEDIIDRMTADELKDLLHKYTNVNKAGQMARAIKGSRPRTTHQLRAVIYNPRDVAPIFQALRIAVNDEIGEIERAVASVPAILPAGGKCVAITFHSGEDKIVKDAFREWTRTPGDPSMPAPGPAAPFRLLESFKPSDAEIKSNPRSRSSHLRAVEKISII